MELRIEWPTEGVEIYDASRTLNEADSILLGDILTLSFCYDVIIDNGVVTFVEKS